MVESEFGVKCTKFVWYWCQLNWICSLIKFYRFSFNLFKTKQIFRFDLTIGVYNALVGAQLGVGSQIRAYQVFTIRHASDLVRTNLTAMFVLYVKDAKFNLNFDILLFVFIYNLCVLIHCRTPSRGSKNSFTSNTNKFNQNICKKLQTMVKMLWQTCNNTNVI